MYTWFRVFPHPPGSCTTLISVQHCTRVLSQRHIAAPLYCQCPPVFPLTVSYSRELRYHIIVPHRVRHERRGPRIKRMIQLEKLAAIAQGLGKEQHLILHEISQRVTHSWKGRLMGPISSALYSVVDSDKGLHDCMKLQWSPSRSRKTLHAPVTRRGR